MSSPSRVEAGTSSFGEFALPGDFPDISSKQLVENPVYQLFREAIEAARGDSTRHDARAFLDIQTYMTLRARMRTPSYEARLNGSKLTRPDRMPQQVWDDIQATRDKDDKKGYYRNPSIYFEGLIKKLYEGFAGGPDRGILNDFALFETAYALGELKKEFFAQQPTSKPLSEAA